MAATRDTLQNALGTAYLIERELGRGGMAIVYLARDLKHDRLVALKTLRPELVRALGPERFLREIQITARLQHPNILPLHDSGEADGLLYYVMPYVEGESLRSRMDREGQLPLEDALHIAGQVTGALAYAHSHGVVHRDIKPENILLDGDHALVADFGIARAITEAGGERLTETGLAIGTATYMSPEQAAADARVDGRSDIYSLGCVLYEMIAGEPPFRGTSAQAVIARKLTDPVPPLRTVRESAPPVLERVVAKALAKVPADRFATAAEFAAALASSMKANGPYPRKKILGAAGGAIALVVGAALSLPHWRSAPTKALDRDRIVVAPFSAASPSLRTLSEELVEYLSRSLDGAGTLRTASPSAYLRSWHGKADVASALALSRRTGAGLAVYGELAMVGKDSVRLRGALLDSQTGDAPAEFEVRGDSARIDLLADSLTITLLRTLGRIRAIAVVRSAPFSKASLPALKEFLRGEHFYRRSQWDSAISHYDNAIELDSGFAVPYRRMTLVLGWHSPGSMRYESDRSYAMKAAALNHGLAPRDSLLITSDSLFYVNSGTAYFRDRRQLFATLEEAARRYPGDPEIWLSLGEARLHDGTVSFWGWGAAPPDEVLNAFDRAIALDSGFAPAYEHTAELALLLGKPELALRYQRAEAAARGTALKLDHQYLLELLLDPKWARKPEVSRLIETASIGRLWSIAGPLNVWPDSGETAIRILRSLTYGRHTLNPTTFRHVADTLLRRRGLAAALALRGHLHEAYETFALPESGPPNTFTDLALLGIIPSSTASAHFKRVLEDESQWGQNDATGPVPHPTGPRQALAYWFAQRDTAALKQIIDRAGHYHRSPDPIARAHVVYLAATAHAYLTLIRGDSVRAVEGFAALPDSLCLLDTCFFEQLTYAQLLVARSQDNEAATTLDRWLWGRRWSPLYVMGVLERGRVAERLRDRDKAIKSYRLVADTWERPDPELLPYMTEARTALSRLTAEAAH